MELNGKLKRLKFYIHSNFKAISAYGVNIALEMGFSKTINGALISHTVCTFVGLIN